jgi:hypothetical protein
MREELHQFLNAEITKLDSTKRWVSRNVSFAYNSLAKEVQEFPFLLGELTNHNQHQMCGVYVRAYAEMADPMSFKLEDPQDFLVSLMVCTATQ